MDQLTTIPIIQQALFLLREAGSVNGIKVTETGALGRNFVQALWDQLLKTSEDDLVFRPTRELECPEATRIHFLLSENKYIRKYKGKICLTEKGKSVLKNQDYRELYHDLLAAQIFLWSWGYEDRYPDYEFIQSSSEVLLASLYAWPTTTISPEQLYNEVFEENLPKEAAEFKEDLCRCLTVRFFYRFCIPFGIIKPEEGDHFLDKKITDSFEKTDFFINSFMELMKKPPESSVKPTKTKAEKRSLSSSIGGFTPAAEKFWNKLNPKIRMRLMNNAFCSSCKGETSIGNISGDIKKGDLVLSGSCTKCGEPVARLVEGD